MSLVCKVSWRGMSAVRRICLLGGHANVLPM